MNEDDPLKFPPSILVRRIWDPNKDAWSELLAGETPADIDDPDASQKTARYVLVGTGSIHHSAAVYLEDAKA